MYATSVSIPYEGLESGAECVRFNVRLMQVHSYNNFFLKLAIRFRLTSLAALELLPFALPVGVFNMARQSSSRRPGKVIKQGLLGWAGVASHGCRLSIRRPA